MQAQALIQQKVCEVKHKLKMCEKTLQYWEGVEIELKNQYGNNPLPYQIQHIKKVKQYKKNKKSEVLYWSNELNILLNKQETILTFG